MKRTNFYGPAVNTIIAPWYTILLAKLFGKRRIGYDSGYKVTCHLWRGKLYVTDSSIDTLD